MAFKLPRFDRNIPLVTEQRTSTTTFHQWWDAFAKSIEGQETRQDELFELILQALEQAGIAIEQSNNALNAAGAIMPDIPSVIINADYTGAILEGQLPRDITAQRFDNDVDVSASATWSATTLSGDIAYTIDGGVLTVTALVTSAVVQITSVYDGISRSRKVSITKLLADPPQSSGAGQTSVYDSSIQSTNSAVYGPANAGPLTLTCGPSGEVTLTAPLDTFVTTVPPEIEYYSVGKWQVSPAGAGTWTDVDTEIMGIWPATKDESGSISVNMTASGLTPATDYDFQLLLRNESGVTTISYAGTATATTDV